MAVVRLGHVGVSANIKIEKAIRLATVTNQAHDPICIGVVVVVVVVTMNVFFLQGI